MPPQTTTSRTPAPLAARDLAPEDAPASGYVVALVSLSLPRLETRRSSPAAAPQHNSDLIQAIQAHQAAAARAQLQRQQHVVAQAEALAREHTHAIRAVLEGDARAREGAAATSRGAEAALVRALQQAERELLASLQTEASTAELAAAAVQSEVEGLYQASRRAAESLTARQQEEAQGIAAALDGIWPRGEGDGEEGKRESLRAHGNGNGNGGRGGVGDGQ
ncbi:hypothetical protein JCM21900_003093 [Sporobolomyces salmonicolor]